MNFAVSMTSSILAGNITIIRVSNKPFEQVDIICDAMNALINGEYGNMKSISAYAGMNIAKELRKNCQESVMYE